MCWTIIHGFQNFEGGQLPGCPSGCGPDKRYIHLILCTRYFPNNWTYSCLKTDKCRCWSRVMKYESSGIGTGLTKTKSSAAGVGAIFMKSSGARVVSIHDALQPCCVNARLLRTMQFHIGTVLKRKVSFEWLVEIVSFKSSGKCTVVTKSS